MRNLLRRTMLTLLLIISNQVFAGKIYTWKDADGQAHFSSTPPPQVEAKSTGLTTGTSGFNTPSPQSSGTASHQSGNTKPYAASHSSWMEQQKGGKETSRMKQDTRQQQAKRAAQANASSKAAKQNDNWQQKVIDKCKANRGVNCDDPRYVQSKRPLTEAERAELNRAREERNMRNAIERANRSCIRGGC